MHIIVLITAANKKEADTIARKLIKNKLAACVNIISGIKSLFWWQGKLDRAKEALLMVKSRKEKFNKIVKAVKSSHSYSVPEIIAIPITSGFKPYLKWIDDSLR
ncbi:MAG: divalent-cation tolerance protein CutA [Candidatus Omnitrophica bacterium]|nr:divalent-cation tolerance protein CutA [Candidatus Omnitrophota bacterium]